MKLKEYFMKDYQNTVKSFGKKPAIILYILLGLEIAIALLIGIIHSFNEDVAWILLIIGVCIGIIAIIYLIIICRLDNKEEEEEHEV